MAFWPSGKNPHGAKINMIRRFLRNESGQFAMMTAIATVPLLGGLALAIDYSEMSRQRQETLNALDAAGIATARQAISGASDADLIVYANNFFKANLSSVHPNDTSLTVILPKNNTGGGTLKMSARFTYEPYFFSGFTKMVNGVGSSTEMDFSAKTEIRLKNTLEVALVLDNSGSMEYVGTGSGMKRIDLLKDAAKQLVDTISLQAAQMKQVSKPVQFSLVPFAASVNVGPDNADAAWMDRYGISPIHHENFDWSTMAAADSTKKVELSGGSYYKRGTGWGAEKDKIITRFTLYKDMQRQTGTEFIKTGTEDYCIKWNKKGTSCTQWGTRDVGYDKAVYSSFASWGGCVEARPSPYNVSDAAPVSGTPATLFVPMFAPDETDQVDSNSRPANNNWWKDVSTDSSAAVRQRYMPKYYTPAPEGTAAMGLDQGPNTSCSNTPITPLVDVSDASGLTKIKNAITDMIAKGATNVPEGLAWGWRSISGGPPFTEGRPDTEKGNDKVVIVLTDGANTYYTPSSVTAQSYSGTNWQSGGNDLAGAKAIYSSYGYLAPYANAYSTGRLFLGTNNITKTDYSNANYSKAMDEHLAAVCTNAKTANVIVMTVALDLDPTKGTAAEKAATTAQITGLTNCASMSRFRNAKLFWNTKGGDLAKTFKEIADELSNLRIVG